MQVILTDDVAGQEGRKRQLGASADAKCAKLARRSLSSTSAEPGNSSDNECSDIADGVERIHSGLPALPCPAGTGFAAQELGHAVSRRSENAELSATYSALYERSALGDRHESGESGHAPTTAEGHDDAKDSHASLANDADMTYGRHGAASVPGPAAGCSTSCGKSSSGVTGKAALAGFGQDVLRREFLRLCKEEESIKAALKQVRLEFNAARRAVVVRSSAAASASTPAAQAPVHLPAQGRFPIPTCAAPPVTKSSEPVRSREQLIEQQRLRQLMPPPPPPPAPGAHQQPCAHRPQPAAHCGAHAPRPQAGSAPWLPAAPSQLMLQQSAAVGGAPALYGVASFGPQQRQQSLPPRMQVGPAMAPVHAPHGAAPSPPRHHTTSYVSREQFMQLQLLSAVAARQQAAFRGVPSANR